MIPGAALFFSVVDGQGQAVDAVDVVISVEHEDPFGFYHFGGTRLFEEGSGGLFPFMPLPSNPPATILFQAVTPAGGVSDTLVISNFEYAQAIVSTEADFVGVHQFELGTAGVTTNLTLVSIDIKPGSDPNSINLGSQGFIPIAILATPIFDPADVDQSSLTLAGSVARVKINSGNIGSFQDVDGDGDLDLLVQFPTAGLQLTEADTESVLEGTTLAGTPFQGVDAIIVVP